MNNPVPQDQSREGINIDKIKQVFRLLIPKNSKTLVRLARFSDLDLDKIKEEKGIEIKGLILDIDGCLAFNHQDILPENVEHVRKLLSKGIRMVVYSNMIWSPRYNALPPEITILTNIAPKPSREGFETACQKLGLAKENIAMAGDNYITDGGAINSGIHFIHIKPLIAKGRGFFETLHDWIDLFFVKLAEFYDNFRKN